MYLLVVSMHTLDPRFNEHVFQRTRRYIERSLSFLPMNTLIKNLDLTNPRYVEQNFLVLSGFVKTRVHCM